jgi:hypothetical protein
MKRRLRVPARLEAHLAQLERQRMLEDMATASVDIITDEFRLHVLRAEVTRIEERIAKRGANVTMFVPSARRKSDDDPDDPPLPSAA